MSGLVRGVSQVWKNARGPVAVYLLSLNFELSECIAYAEIGGTHTTSHFNPRAVSARIWVTGSMSGYVGSLVDNATVGNLRRDASNIRACEMIRALRK